MTGRIHEPEPGDKTQISTQTTQGSVEFASNYLSDREASFRCTDCLWMASGRDHFL